MTDETRDATSTKETGALLLATGGLAAAFGAASCCAIPAFLASLGLGSAWLAGIAIFAAPHRIALITAAVICLAGAAIVLVRYRRTLVCAPGAACGNRAITPLVIGFLSLGAMLAVAGYLFA